MKITFSSRMMLALVAPLLALPALADETTTITRRTVTEPGMVIEQPALVAPTVIERRTVVVPNTEVISTPVVDSTVTRRTVEINRTTVPDTAVSSTFVLTREGVPAFRRRLSLMNDQVTNGLKQGWLTSLQADRLHARADAIASSLDAICNDNDYTTSTTDALEQQANALNIDIADSMKNAPSVGSTTIINQ